MKELLKESGNICSACSHVREGDILYHHENTPNADSSADSEEPENVVDLDDSFYVPRTILLPKNSKLTKAIIQHLDHILDDVTPEEYLDTLIELYHMYILHQHHSLPYNFEEIANQVFYLIDFLKVAREEMHEK